MKKVLLCMSMFFLMMCQAGASLITLAGTEISLQFPDDCYVITPDTPIDSPLFSELGFTDPQSVIDNLTSNGILANVMFQDNTYEIVAGSPPIETTYNSSLSDFSQGTAEDIQALYDEMERQFEGTSITSTHIYLCNDFDYPYLVIDIMQPNGDIDVHSREYYTWVNNTAFYLTLHDYTGNEVSVQQDQILRSIIETVTFPQPVKDAIEPAPPSDLDNDVSSVIPTDEEEQSQSMKSTNIIEFLIPLMLSLASWLLPWFFLWTLHDSMERNDFYLNSIIPNEGDIITADGNNLFKTGIAYSIMLFISLIIHWAILDWIILLLTVAFCVPPIIGFILNMLDANWRRGMIWPVHISRIICTFMPLVTSVIIYIFAIG